MTVALIYLARGEGGGLAAADDFLKRYRDHPPGCPHSLTVVAKGWAREPGLEKVRVLAENCGARVIEVADDGFDWGAYFRVAPTMKQSWLCLLNTHSRPLRDGWLARLRDAADAVGVGAAGASGSWGSLTPKLADYPSALAAAAYFPFQFLRNLPTFPRFPNPHLRSTGLLMRRDLFCAFADANGIPRRKRDAHALESGRRGLTAFLAMRGLRVVLASADGQRHEVADWPDSGTFRVPGQANLLIADNQTRAYGMADRRTRRMLEVVTWGRPLTP